MTPKGAPRQRITPRGMVAGERITPRSASSHSGSVSRRAESPLYGLRRSEQPVHAEHRPTIAQRRETGRAPLTLDSRFVGSVAASTTAGSVPSTSPGRSANPHARNPTPVRTSGASGENRRDIHLASQTLSKAAAETKGALSLEKQLTALQKRFAVTDEQLTQSKLELRNVRRENERLQLEYEEMNRRCHAAQAERSAAMKQLNEVKEEKSKVEMRMTVAVSQQGKGAMQRQAKMLETVKDLRSAKEEVDSALLQAQDRIAQLEDDLAAARSALQKREEHLGLIPVGSSADAKANRCSVLLAVSKLEMQQDALKRDKEALEAEKEELAGQVKSAGEELGQLSKQVGELQEALAERDGRLESLGKDVAEQDNEKTRLENERSVMLQYINEESSKTDEYKSLIKALQEDKEALLDTLEQQGGGGGNEGPLNAQAATQVQALEQELRVVSDKAAAAEAELKTVNERALELSQEVEHLNDDLDRLTERNQNLSHEVAALKEGGGAGREVPGGGRDLEAITAQLELERQVCVLCSYTSCLPSALPATSALLSLPSSLCPPLCICVHVRVYLCTMNVCVRVTYCVCMYNIDTGIVCIHTWIHGYKDTWIHAYIHTYIQKHINSVDT